MRKESRRMALCGMMVALGMTVMLMGSVIPLATFCCPVIASLALVPVLVEWGKKWSMAAYAAIALLSLMISPDKESALLFAFLGYYPAVKPQLDRIKKTPLRIAAKLGIFNLAAAAMMLVIAFVLNMQAIVAEYAAMGTFGIAAFIVLANITMLAYDRMVLLTAIVYIRKFRKNITKGM